MPIFHKISRKSSLDYQSKSLLESQEFHAKDLLWLDLNDDYEEAKTLLTANFPQLDSNIIDSLIFKKTRPEILVFEQGISITLNIPNKDPNKKPEDVNSLKIWLDKKHLITLHEASFTAIDELALETKNHRHHNPKQLLLKLLKRLFHEFESIIEDLANILDKEEEDILDNASSNQRKEIAVILKRAIIFRRLLIHQKEIILQLKERIFLETEEQRALDEVIDKITRFTEMFQMYIDRSHVLQNELGNILTIETNQKIFFLTIVASIFLPLNFIVGLFGVNLGGMPGAEHGFPILAIILSLLVIISLLTLKRMKI